MDDMQALEQRIAGEMLRRAGPSHPVDDLAIYRTVASTTSSPTWRLGTMFGAARLVLVGVVLVLVGGFLTAGLLAPPPETSMAPAAVGSGEATSAVRSSPPATPEAVDVGPLGQLRAAQPPGWNMPVVVTDAITDQRFDDAATSASAAMFAVEVIIAADAALPDVSVAERYRSAYESAGTVEALHLLAQDAAALPSAGTTGANEQGAYEAVARLVVNPGPDPTVQDLTVAEAAVRRYAELAVSRPVLQAVIDASGLEETAEVLRQRIESVASLETLAIVVSVRDDDPRAASDIARSVGNELRKRVRDSIITDDMVAAEEAIATTEGLIRTLERRLNTLTRKQPKTAVDRSEIISLAEQLSALRRDIQDLRPASRSHARNLLEWFEMPTAPE